jgi:hypothetical protein
VVRVHIYAPSCTAMVIGELCKQTLVSVHVRLSRTFSKVLPIAHLETGPGHTYYTAVYILYYTIHTYIYTDIPRYIPSHHRYQRLWVGSLSVPCPVSPIINILCICVPSTPGLGTARPVAVRTLSAVVPSRRSGGGGCLGEQAGGAGSLRVLVFPPLQVRANVPP